MGITPTRAGHYGETPSGGLEGGFERDSLEAGRRLDAG